MTTTTTATPIRRGRRRGPPPPHGTRRRYIHGPSEEGVRGKGCHCPRCRAAHAAAANRRNRLKVYGKWQPYADAGPVEEHLAALAALGIKSKRVSELSGVSYPAVVRIAKGEASRVRTATADKILAVPLSRDLLRPRARRIDAAGARRRLQALIAIGWSRAKLEEKVGIGADHLARIINGGTARADTIQRITQAYEELWNTPPVEETRGDRYAARGARREAEEKDWPRPAEWDDDLIDLPDAELAEKLAEMAGEMSNAELWACYQARYREGDRSPLAKAAVTEHHRRRREKRAEAKAS